MATHSSVLAWRIPGMGEPGGLSSMGSHRVGHDWSDLAASSRFRDGDYTVNVYDFLLLYLWEEVPFAITPYKLELLPLHDSHTLIITTPAAFLCPLVHLTQMLDKALLLTQNGLRVSFFLPSFLSPPHFLSLYFVQFFFFFFFFFFCSYQHNTKKRWEILDSLQSFSSFSLFFPLLVL